MALFVIIDIYFDFIHGYINYTQHTLILEFPLRFFSDRNKKCSKMKIAVVITQLSLINVLGMGDDKSFMS